MLTGVGTPDHVRCGSRMYVVTWPRLITCVLGTLCTLALVLELPDVIGSGGRT
jgi:hypothetical protein